MGLLCMCPKFLKKSTLCPRTSVELMVPRPGTRVPVLPPPPNFGTCFDCVEHISVARLLLRRLGQYRYVHRTTKKNQSTIAS